MGCCCSCLPMPKIIQEKTKVTQVNNPIQNKHGIEKKDRKKRLSTSPFHVIINTNQNFNAGSKELEDTVELLRQTTDKWILGENIRNYIIFKEGEWDDLIKIKTVQAVERGPKYNQPHVHCGVKIKHRAKVHIDCERLAALYNEALGWSGTEKRVFIRSRVHPVHKSFTDVITDYLNKNM
jgi:hypothetical protein